MSQEIAVIKQQVSKAVNAARELTISSPEELTKSVDILSKIKKVGKMIKDRMEAPIKRAYEAYKDIKAEQEKTFGEMLVSYQEAESIVKKKMVEYQNQIEAERKRGEEKLAAQVESGYLKPETAAQKLEKLPEVPERAEGNVGTILTRIIPKYEILDESLLPREYLMPDRGKIWEAVRSGVKEIPGCRIWEEKNISGGIK